MNEITAVQIGVWQLVTFLGAVVAAFAGVIWTFSRVFIRQLDKRFDERDAKLTAQAEKINEVDKEILRLRAELPSAYVLREDWIRFCSVIDTKLDWLREKGDATKELVVQLIGEAKKKSGSGNDR